MTRSASLRHRHNHVTAPTPPISWLQTSSHGSALPGARPHNPPLDQMLCTSCRCCMRRTSMSSLLAVLAAAAVEASGQVLSLFSSICCDPRTSDPDEALV